jgi:hypothetical protein
MDNEEGLREGGQPLRKCKQVWGRIQGERTAPEEMQTGMVNGEGLREGGGPRGDANRYGQYWREGRLPLRKCKQVWVMWRD